MFYEFSQNNSGGYFKVDDKVCHRLFIEADDKDEAIYKAGKLGCYWNGVSEGIDCECCGDRWHMYCDEYTDKDFPKDYNVTSYSGFEEWYKRYGDYTIKNNPSPDHTSIFSNCYKGTLCFNTIEEYAQFLANEYGATKPDIRIFYKNGNVKEIFKSEK